MEKTLRMSLLFDFYGPLLTERQQHIFQMYFHEDLSLGEIADELGVSRQAVHDMLRRAETIFEKFERKLALLAKHQERQVFYEQLLNELRQIRSADEQLMNLVFELEEKIVKAQATS